MAVYRRLTQLVLERLAQGPARPCEIVKLLHVEPCDASRLLKRLTLRGQVHRTRIVLTGRHGGNTAVIYQLLQ